MKFSSSQAKTAPEEVPTVGMNQAERSSSENSSAAKSGTAAGAAAVGAAAAAAAASSSAADKEPPAADGASDADAASGTRRDSGTPGTSAADEDATGSHGDDSTAQDSTAGAAPDDSAGDMTAKSVAETGDSQARSAEADATEKFRTRGSGQGADAEDATRGPGTATDAQQPHGAAGGAGEPSDGTGGGPATAGAAGAAGLVKKAAGDSDPGSEDQTVAMRVVNPAEEPTTGIPVQRGTDRVVPPAGSRPAVTPPPNTPRGPGGPRQAGQQGGQHGPGAQQESGGARGPGAPQGPGAHQGPGAPQGPGGPPRQSASAPSPADIQPTRPAEQVAERQRQVAPPQRIDAPQVDGPGDTGPKRSKRWLLAVGAAAVLVLALIATVVALMTGGDNSPEGQVRTAIGEYTDALRDGDLEALRSSTCGQLNEFYQGLTAEEFNGVHQLSTEEGSLPIVASVDAVRITGDTALAEATVYTDSDPERTARTFDLERTDGTWKVCDPTGTTP